MPELVDLRHLLLGEVRPALAPDGTEWTVELQQGGYRIIAAVDGDQRLNCERRMARMRLRGTPSCSATAVDDPRWGSGRA